MDPPAPVRRDALPDRWVSILAVRLVVGGVLVAAATAKGVALYRGDPPAVLGLEGFPAGALLVSATITEAAAGFLLLGSGWRVGGLIAFWLGVLFSLVVAGLLLAGRPLHECGCFGAGTVPVRAHVLSILGLLLSGRFLLGEANRSHP